MWMMAPNWSFKAEALYYAPASIANQINNFTGSATVRNTVTSHVNFQGVILRVGLNYHFNLL
jgi:outer membrane immunogenic protein